MASPPPPAMASPPPPPPPPARLDRLIPPPPEAREPATPTMAHSTLPATRTAAASKVQARRVDAARTAMTPPPSSQMPPSSRRNAGTPTPPLSQTSTPPPSVEGPSQSGQTACAFAPGLSGEELAAASPEQLRLAVQELQGANTQAMHWKLRYHMLAQDSAAAMERMAVEARMAQTESDVIAHAEHSRIPVTPLSQQEGFIPVQKALYQRMVHDNRLLRERVEALERGNKEQERTIAMQEDEIASRRDRALLLGQRIRQMAGQQQPSRRPADPSRVEAATRSVHSPPLRRPASGSQQPQAFAALVQASEMASQESARSAGKKGRSQNAHSTSSLPATPQPSQRIQQQPYHTPSGRQQPRPAPLTAPAARTTALRTPDVYAPSSLLLSHPQDPQDPQSDGTVSASESDSEAETDIIDRNDHIPEFKASRSASQMLRSRQQEEQQSKRERLGGGGMLEPSRCGVERLRQTRLFGQVRKSNVVRAGYGEDESPAKRRRPGERRIGLGISDTRDWGPR